MNTKRWMLLAVLAVLLTAIAIIIAKTCDYYADAPQQNPYPCHQHDDDTLRVILIGDSWVCYHHQHDAHLSRLLQDLTQQPVKVVSYGLCGKTSKEIYSSLFDDNGMRQLLTHGSDYCFLSVGINDTYKKTGAASYARHTMQTLRFLCTNHIIPIILEIPNYDITFAFERQTVSRKLLRRLSMLFTGSPLDCREEYRKALRETIQNDDIANKTLIIPAQSWSPHLYHYDRMHLNDLGYQTLDTCIAHTIAGDLEGHKNEKKRQLLP